MRNKSDNNSKITLSKNKQAGERAQRLEEIPNLHAPIQAVIEQRDELLAFAKEVAEGVLSKYELRDEARSLIATVERSKP